MIKKILLFMLLSAVVIVNNQLYSASIVDVKPLTNKIIMVHFDDGAVFYPNKLEVDRLNTADADKLSSWLLSSSDDGDFASAINPKLVGRKSKGTEFVKDVPWGNGSADPTGKPWASEHWVYLVLEKAMKTGKNYSLNCGGLAKNGSQWPFVFDEKLLRSEAVHVNTLGYETNAPKYGYVYQWMGSLGGLDLSAYSGNKFWVYKGDEVVKEGVLKKRKSATNPETGQSNDTPNKNFLGSEVYECDFSSITSDGIYKLVVEGIGSSYSFKIGKDAVWEAYYNVARALYYQRSGVRLAPPYAADGYIRPVNQNTKLTSDDGTSFAGKLLYSDYSFMDWDEGDGGGNSKAAIRAAAEGKPLDVAGWYHDAGDWDSYYTHHRIPILLMLTWEFAPERFADNELNIPESGNGIPDLVDEASWLIKFNYRLRKELMSRGYSNGGVGGARICADVFTEIDGSSESSLPSWKEKRRTVVTKADAFMTYFYAGQAAQFACILKQLGKNPNNFPVEMLDHIDFSSMSKDKVNWVREAEEAFAWAIDPKNQPAKSTNYPDKLETYKLYAAVNLFRLTGKEEYHTIAKTELSKLRGVSRLSEDERWGVYSYLLCTGQKTDKLLQSELKNMALGMANLLGRNSADNRACRWGGDSDFPMLVGQATTPWVFENLIAACISDNKVFEDVVHTTADYFLGNNPLHTTWMTGVGPRPATAGFHLDTRYNNNWVNYPGFIPYGPWSMAYGFEPYTYTIDGVSIKGGQGTWNKDWANYSMYPLMENWPGHERYNGNIHAPMSTENTIHQNTVYGAITYGFVNNRSYKNGTSPLKIGFIQLCNDSLLFTAKGAESELIPTTDIQNATFSALTWKSSEPRIAYVDALGKVTAITSGKCVITCSTRDGSVLAECAVTCLWDEVAVDKIRFEKESFSLFKGQSRMLPLVFEPENATNQFVNFTLDNPLVVSIDENGLLMAIAKGEAIVTATSLNGGKIATCKVVVKGLNDYVIADFDNVVPVTTEPQDFISQLYTPEGTNNVECANPLLNEANQSNKVLKWGRPSGNWRLLGFVLPKMENQDLSQFIQFQFKYYGEEIKDFYIQLIGKKGTIEINQTVDGYDCWKLFACELNSTDSIQQVNVFVNKTANSKEFTCYFDDFVLSGTKTLPFTGLSINENQLNLKREATFQLIADAQGNPFSWVSSDINIAVVDQNGMVTAVAGGTTTIKAVPLYGDAVECIVNVEGDGNDQEVTDEVFLDFESISLDWSAGYGAFAWNSDKQGVDNNPLVNEKNGSSKVFKWVRDISGNALWGGYGIVLPLKNTKGWERISFQVFNSDPVSSIRLELSQGETKVGEYTYTDLEIPASSWKEVDFSLVDLAMVNKTFDKIVCQIAGGASTPIITTYSDNFKFEKGPNEVDEETNAVNNNKTMALAVEIYPNPARDKVHIWCDNGLESVSFFDAYGRLVDHAKLKGEKSTTWNTTGINHSMCLLKITDKKKNSYYKKLLIN